MSGPDLLTVILNYRTPAMTFESVAAALHEMERIAGEIVVVDNDSGDGSFEWLVLEVAAAGWGAGNRVRVIQSGGNGGYGAGNNAGIRAGLTAGRPVDFYYILNSDAFPDAGSIRSLVDYLTANPAIGFAGSYIHGPDGDPHGTAFRFPTVLGEFEGAARTGPISRLLARYRVPLGYPETTRAVDWLAGASVMMRREALAAAGLFDERYFLYFDETDLCLRASRAGWPTAYVRESSVTHVGSVSTGMKTWERIPQYWFDSRLRYFVKNHGPLYAAAATVMHVAGVVVWRARCLAARRPVDGPKNFLRDLIRHDLGGLLPCDPRKGYLKPEAIEPAG